MEFKNIDSSSITECCEYLKINRQDLPEVVQSLKDLKGLDKLVVARLNLLLNADKAAIEACENIEQYEKYLSTWPDGLYHHFAKHRIAQLKAETEEHAFYEKHKGRIWECKKYLKKYPYGKYSDEIRSILRRKRRVRNITFFGIVISALVIWGIFSYEPLPTIDVPSEINVSQYGDTIGFDKYVKGGIDDDNIHLMYLKTLNNGNRQTNTIGKGKIVYRNDNHKEVNLNGISSSDCMNLDWPDNSFSFLNDEYIIPMNASSHERARKIHITAISTLFGLVIRQKTYVVNIKQQSGSATYLQNANISAEWYLDILSTNKDLDGNETINLLVSYYGSQGRVFPIFLTTDGTYICVENSAPSWIAVEKHSDVYGDSFPFYICVSKNRSAQNRIGHVTFSCGDKYIKLVLKQKSGYASYFDVGQDEIILGAREVWEYTKGYYHGIKTDGIWDCEQQSGHDWLRVGKDDIYNGIRIFVKENNSLCSRSAMISISTINMGRKTIIIKQRSNRTTTGKLSLIK